MNLQIQKPYLLFWFSIPIIIFIGFIDRNGLLDINIHDTYFVITNIHLAILISIIFGLIGLGYWIMQETNRKLSKWLNLIHVGFTIGGSLCILILLQLFRQPKTETFLSDLDYNTNLNMAMLMAASVLVFGQVFYLFNILNGLIKKPL